MIVASLAFSAIAGGSSPAAKTFTVTGPAWTATENVVWLSVARSGDTVTVTPALGSLAAGTYTTDVTVASASQTRTVAVTFTVEAALTVAPTALAFSAVEGGSSPAATRRAHV